jgi:DNA-binding PadR family transcriptional regulator
MDGKIKRDLTTLEHIILGLVGTSPQSGYSINTALKAGIHRWRASPGSIYPALKRLEQDEAITSQIEFVTETRSRKVHTLTPKGAGLLDQWVRALPTQRELTEERDIVLVKFLFAETRLTGPEILAWLDEYETSMDILDSKLRILYQFARGVATLHQNLIYEAIMIERIGHRRWLKRARQRLLAKGNSSEEREVESAEPLPELAW